MNNSRQNLSWSRLAGIVLAAALITAAASQKTGAQNEGYTRLPITNEAWNKPYPAFQIVGNLYYVGGYDLASFLITSRDGHILINTGAYDSVPTLKSNVESLGFSFADIKVLLTTQAHWDHVAGFAEIKRMTGSRLMVHKDDAPVIETGGVHQFFNSDPLEFTSEHGGAVFEPAKVDRRLRHGSIIGLGKIKITLHHHPGHTKGASSFTFDTRDEKKEYTVLIVNMGSVNSNRGVKLLGMPLFPNIAQSYAKTFAAQKRLAADVWVSSHAGHFNLHDKHKPGDPYNPQNFIDPDGYLAKIKLYEAHYLELLRKERSEADLLEK